MQDLLFKKLPLFIPHSNTTTAGNKTGSWRFFQPRYDEKTAPCAAACPLGQDIARIEMLTTRGLLKDAWQLMLNENPFPSVCGRVCFHPCESACNRRNLDVPIAIHHLERFLGDTALLKQRIPDFRIKPDAGRKVAIAGAGPSGLAAAYFLARLGYDCEVYEASSKPGGLLRHGIPTYRLPHNVLDQEIKRIEGLGVPIHCETPVTQNLLEKICAEYDALFIGCGFGRSIALPIEGGDLAQHGRDFLRRFHQGEKMSFVGKAAIFGGGNTAVDVARCLKRLGASPLILYRRRQEDMPAFEPEIKLALEEGVEIIELVTPLGIRQSQSDPPSSVTNYTITLQQLKISERKIGGRAGVIPDAEKTQTINVQHIFVAIGAVADAFWHFPETENSKVLSLSHCKLSVQKIPLIFGGDLITPVKSVADAIASGKQAALALHAYFAGGPKAVDVTLTACRVGPGPALSLDAYLAGDRRERSPQVVAYEEIVGDYFQAAARVIPARLEASRRVRSFAEVESILSDSGAKEEANRCFNCGTCNACDYCRLYCPEMAINLENGQRSIDLDYCKGCGICATECPRNAMALVEEIK